MTPSNQNKNILTVGENLIRSLNLQKYKYVYILISRNTQPQFVQVVFDSYYSSRPFGTNKLKNIRCSQLIYSQNGEVQDIKFSPARDLYTYNSKLPSNAIYQIVDLAGESRTELSKF